MAAQRLKAAQDAGDQTAISSVVLFELWYGAARSSRPQQGAAEVRFFTSGEVAVVPFEEADAAVAGDLRQQLARAGTPIGAYDFLIAAQALRRGATLVTSNTVEFSRVPKLNLTDWTI
jgi:tRNA(fMet)-specific endonuclease VapC